jgi:small subunit ribosomal protein S5
MVQQGGRGGRGGGGGGGGGGGRGQRGDRGRRDRRRDGDPDGPEYIEKVVDINRVAKVVKGGRRFSFTAIVVVGDGQGRVGFGMGRANEVPEAIRKGGVIARRAMTPISLRQGTIAHETIARFKASRVVMRPAAPGTGIIAGGGVRAVMEAAGVTDVLTKSLGSNNPVNLVRATIEGLTGLRHPKEVVAARRALIGAD